VIKYILGPDADISNGVEIIFTKQWLDPGHIHYVHTLDKIKRLLAVN